MSIRFAKQIIYAAFFFIFWYFTITFVYHWAVKPAPTCSDGLQNQGEGGVDCGGPCALACNPFNIKPIEEVESVIKFNPDQTHFSLVAHIQNPNYSYAAKSFDYRFFLYDDQGNVVDSYSGTSFLYGSEVKYILLPNAQLPKVPFTRVGFKIENPNWVGRDAFNGPPKLDTTNINTRVANGMVAVDGEITSKENIIFPKITIIAVFRGKYSQDAGVSQTEINNLLPRTPQPFSIIHPSMPNLDPAATKVFYYAARP